MPRPPFWLRLLPAGAAFVLGAIIDYLELGTDDMGIIAGLLLIGGAGIGFASSRGAWRWGLLLGLSVLAVELLAPVLGIRALFGTHPVAALIAVGFTLIGAYLGVGGRWLLRHAHDSPV